jgi:lipoprotein-anchoring transpeptidase ErfK/SrfK
MKDIAALEKKIDKLTTQGPYLIVNTTENRFYLYDGKSLIREGRCSTGKNTRLIDEKRKKHYDFKTPRGVHKVLGKQKNPVWAKPNWAFIEDGLPIPPQGHESRFDGSTLGDYKLDIGDGYMVHGTLWKRRMGLPVTHGCVRLLDEDLEVVFNTMPIGSKVIIY